MNQKEKLQETTILALQGKLTESIGNVKVYYLYAYEHNKDGEDNSFRIDDDGFFNLDEAVEAAQKYLQENMECKYVEIELCTWSSEEAYNDYEEADHVETVKTVTRNIESLEHTIEEEFTIKESQGKSNKYDNEPTEKRYKELISICFDWIENHISKDDYNLMLDYIGINYLEYDRSTVSPTKYEKVLNKALSWIMEHTSEEEHTINNQIGLTPEEKEFFGITFDSEFNNDEYDEVEMKTEGVNLINFKVKNLINKNLDTDKDKEKAEQLLNVYEHFDKISKNYVYLPKEIIKLGEEGKSMAYNYLTNLLGTDELN